MNLWFMSFWVVYKSKKNDKYVHDLLWLSLGACLQNWGVNITGSIYVVPGTEKCRVGTKMCRTLLLPIFDNVPDSKVHGANMGPTWVLSAPDGPHVCPMNLAIRDVTDGAATVAVAVNTSQPEQNCWHLAEDIFTWTFLNKHFEQNFIEIRL